MMFVERLSADGIQTSPYYQDNKYCAFNGTPNGMPNCTAYAFARSAELSAPNIIRDFVVFNRKGADNACRWFQETLWSKGKEPRLGAIACWDGELGHVAIVEQINGDSVTVSQSNYGGTYWELKTYKPTIGEVTKGVGLVFQGYIYNPFIEDSRTDRNESEQVEVIADRLRVRKSPNGEIYEGLYCPQGIYNVLDKAVNGGYTWAKLNENYWIALNDGKWTRYYNATGKNDGDFDTLCVEMSNCLEEIKTLKNSLELARSKYARLAERVGDLI